MNFKLSKIQELSGNRASVYSIILKGDQTTLFEQFIVENMLNNKKEVLNILERLRLIGLEFGARENFFKMKEGYPGDLVCALYDDPKAKLRLYCIRYGTSTIIIGGGGTKNTRTWQEDPNLDKSAREMMEVSKLIYQRMKDGELEFDPNFLDFEGDLKFNDDEEE